MKRFEIVRVVDPDVGAWFELYNDGQFVGSAGVIRLLRRWAREIWQHPALLDEVDA